MKLLLLCITLAVCVIADKEPRLIWEDNFDWLDEGKWHHIVSAYRGYNNEFQYYRNNRKNSYAEDGLLKIKATPVNEELSDSDIRWGYIEDPMCNVQPCRSQGGQGDTVLPIFSARLHTQGSFSVQYGRIEVRAKIPDGDWLWPAIWMLPETDSYGTWPASGEIDIMESRGNRGLTAPWGQRVGSDLAQSTLHWGPSAAFNGFQKTHYERNAGESFAFGFHVYEVEWTADHIKFRIDGADMGEVWPPGGGFWELGGFGSNPGGANIWGGGGKMAPFDRPFHIILNVAVGGSFFSPDFQNQNYPTPWGDQHPLQDFYESQWQWQPTWANPMMEVDYVRVFEL